MKRNSRKGFIPILVIVLLSIITVLAGTGIVLEKQEILDFSMGTASVFQAEVEIQPEPQQKKEQNEEIIKKEIEPDITRTRQIAEEARLKDERLQKKIESTRLEAERQERARKVSEDLERQTVAYQRKQAEQLLIQQRQTFEEAERQRALETQRQQELVRQEELRRQQELEAEKQLYQQLQSELSSLINQINSVDYQRTLREQQLHTQEGEFVITYCDGREDEINNNYASRGLYFSGMRQAAIEESRISCPIEARNLFNAYTNDSLYPFVLQLQDMKNQFQEYNQMLYSSCSITSSNCSTYMNAAFPINF